MAALIALAGLDVARAQSLERDAVILSRYVWTQEGASLARARARVVMFRDEAGTLQQCATATGELEPEGWFRGRVTTTRAPAPEGHRAAPADHASRPLTLACHMGGLVPVASPTSTLVVGDLFARLGQFVLGEPIEDLASALGTEVSAIPEATAPGRPLRHGPYSLVTRGSWLHLAAAFLDELSALEGSETGPISPGASFDEARLALGIPMHHRTLGNATALQPSVPRDVAVRLASSRMALGNHVGLLELGGRVLVFAWYPVHESTLHALLRSVVIDRHQRGELGGSR